MGLKKPGRALFARKRGGPVEQATSKWVEWGALSEHGVFYEHSTDKSRDIDPLSYQYRGITAHLNLSQTLGTRKGAIEPR